VFVCVLLCGSGFVRGDDARPPNLLLIVTDDQGWWDLKHHGNDDIDTPTLDRLADEGTSFSHFYVSPVCAPTRASLMTGRHYLRTGVYNTRFGGDTMRGEERTIAEELQQAGYRTGLFGKWHLGHFPGTRPNEQGFDEFFGHHHGHIERYDYPDQLYLNDRPVEARGYVTDLFTDAALDFIRRSREEPFFCYLAYNVPHSPFIVGDAHALQERGDTLITKYLERGLDLREARIYAMIERCDENVARLLDALDAWQLAESTCVLFMSDNGGVSRHERLGLRGAKGTAYEGGIRSPLLIRRPDHVPAGKRIDTPVHVIDLFPTLCEFAGLTPSLPLPLDGRSFADLLDAEESPPSRHEYLFHIWDRYRPSMESRWSIHETGTGWKLAGNQLFQLDEDPGERTNLAGKHPQVVRRLRGRFRDWLAEVTEGETFQPLPIVVGDRETELQVSWIDRDWSNPQADGPRYEFRGYDWDTLDRWQPGDAVTWNLDVRHPGRYRIDASYGALSEQQEGTFRVSLGEDGIEGSVQAGLLHDVHERHTLGVIDVTEPGERSLTFEAVTLNGNDLLALNRLWLIRLE
jgi:arylsulfatase A-like enzyme